MSRAFVSISLYLLRCCYSIVIRTLSPEASDLIKRLLKKVESLSRIYSLISRSLNSKVNIQNMLLIIINIAFLRATISLSPFHVLIQSVAWRLVFSCMHVLPASNSPHLSQLGNGLRGHWPMTSNDLR